MKKYIFGAIFLMVTSAIYVNAQSGILSLNFVAPQIYDRSYVSNPQTGEIVFDSSANSFYGRDSSGWAQLGTTAGSSLPPGTIVPYAGSTAPAGFLIADGSAISRTHPNYAALFAIISTTYGSGDGSTTFNLPDLRGIFVRGAGTSSSIGGITYTGTLATKQGDQMQGHIHNLSSSGAQVMLWRTSGGNLSYPTGATLLREDVTSVQGPASDGTNGTPRTGTETRPANISLTYLIKL